VRRRHLSICWIALLAHSELDPHHRDVFDEVLDSLPLTSEQSTMLGLSAMHSTQAVASAINEIADRCL
jgi:hypothetical protein